MHIFSLWEQDNCSVRQARWIQLEILNTEQFGEQLNNSVHNVYDINTPHQVWTTKLMKSSENLIHYLNFFHTAGYYSSLEEKVVGVRPVTGQQPAPPQEKSPSARHRAKCICHPLRPDRPLFILSQRLLTDHVIYPFKPYDPTDFCIFRVVQPSPQCNLKTFSPPPKRNTIPAHSWNLIGKTRCYFTNRKTEASRLNYWPITPG